MGQRPRFWLDSTQVLENYVWARFGGVDWYNYVRSRYCPQPRDKALSLCCGDGLMDRYLIWVGVCRQCEGIDISPQAVALAQHAAAAANLPTLSYRVGDIEKLTLPRQS